MLNFHHLRLFHAIAHDGNLTRAAERLHLSQSALSTQVRKLEGRLGHALFERRGKRLLLTEAGRIALDYADTMFKAGDELLDTLQGRAGSRKILRVGALATLSRNFQLEFLKPLVGREDVDLVVRSGSNRELLADLQSLSLDVMLTHTSPASDAHATVSSHLLQEQPVSLVGRRLGRGRRFRYPESLRELPVMLPSSGSEMRQGFDRAMERVGIRPIILAEVDDMAMLRVLAREAAGVTLVPPIVVQDELASGDLIEHHRLPELSEKFYAVLPRRRFQSTLLAPLLDRFRGSGDRVHRGR